MSDTKEFKKTDISELGEFGLINKLTKNIRLKNAESIKGVGDDAAVLNYSADQVVVTTDLLIEGVHFNLAYTPIKHLGYKAVAVNISDIAAMNATPKQILISIAISNRFGLEAIEELYKGIHMACDDYQVDLIGGDTSSSVKGLFISVTAIGSVEKDKVVYRSGANVKDILCVTGDLGASYMGLQLLERENKIFLADPMIQPNLDGFDYILQRQLKPTARIDMIKYFKENNIVPTSMIDISDGLSSETIHLCINSDKGCRIYENKIPIADQTAELANEFGIEPLICALNGGEDYELLFSVKPEDFTKIKDNPEIKAIGYFTEKSEGINLEVNNGNLIPLKSQGWNSFQK